MNNIVTLEAPQARLFVQRQGWLTKGHHSNLKTIPDRQKYARAARIFDDLSPCFQSSTPGIHQGHALAFALHNPKS
jgi:hypothetical protein